MSEFLSLALTLGAALVCSVVGFSWLALAMETHWVQVRGSAPRPARGVAALRLLGSVALLASLVLCLAADHASMAALVWVMSLAAGAVIVALVLAWKPGWLAPLVGATPMG